MAGTGHPKDIEVEMPEDGPLLGDEGTLQQRFRQQAPKRWRLVEWIIWGVLILFCLVLLSDNIRLRRRQSSISAFGTDLSKSTWTAIDEGSVNTKLLRQCRYGEGYI